MKLAFIISSNGDSDLAIETVKALQKKDYRSEIILLPLTETAIEQVEKSRLDKVTVMPIDAITGDKNTLTQDKLTEYHLSLITNYLTDHEVKRSYIGIPSSNNEKPYQIAQKTDIPCVISNEYMFYDKNHLFWVWLNALVLSKNISFAVPLPATKKIINSVSAKEVQCFVIGHLSIDRAFATNATDIDKANVLSVLQVKPTQELTLVAGTTQKTETDIDFIQALLESIQQYPNIQLRFAIHPGVKDQNAYLTEIVRACNRYQDALPQFKIILPQKIRNKLNDSELAQHDVFLHGEVAGPVAAAVADRVCQAVPGAIPNEYALKGKPSFVHLNNSYMPREIFASNLQQFFTQKPQQPCNRTSLGLESEASAAENMASLVMRN